MGWRTIETGQPHVAHNDQAQIIGRILEALGEAAHAEPIRRGLKGLGGEGRVAEAEGEIGDTVEGQADRQARISLQFQL